MKPQLTRLAAAVLLSTVLVSGVPEGLDALFISELVQKAEQTPLLLHICRDDQRLGEYPRITRTVI